MANKKYHHLIKRGDFWYLRKDGKRFSLETTTATEAMRKRDILLENYRANKKFAFEDEIIESKTFGQMTKEWAKIHEQKIKYSTWRDYRSIMNRHVLPEFKDRVFSEISYKEIEEFISGIDCGNKRKNNILVPMRSIFRWAFKIGEISENIMNKIDNFKLVHSDISPFTDKEISLLLDSIDSFYKPYLMVRFYTGMRCGEINALCWSDFKPEMEPFPKIHINKSYVYNKEGTTKTKGSKRYVDCIPIVIQALKEQEKMTGNQEYIFLTKNGDRMTPDHFREVVWKSALEKAKLKYRPPIQTRHTFATMAISAREDIGWVKNMLGHSSLQMIFRHYYAWIPNNGHINGSLMMGPCNRIDSVEIKSDPKTTQ